ncbi:hypothetical protein OS493_029480 [Desmophyllum pertusum]|uniref:Uncharacterized protein n=1 Tax=Desmophyllum pertusum TaxID=174260 RepID=A0A9W9Y973_9CNID|nr:hypothetical protein OS493_029480 [Desmophyllum pertusum]
MLFALSIRASDLVVYRFLCCVSVKSELECSSVAMVNSTYANAKSSANNPECQRNTSTASTEKRVESKMRPLR